MSARIVEGNVLVPKGARFGIVASRFNHFIVDHLVGGALDAITRHGGDADAVTLVRVPGAWEVPHALQRLARSKKFDGLIALSAVIRGSTPHFDYVAGEIAKGSASVSLVSGLPIACGVLTAGNKGWDAACTIIEMVSLDRALAEQGT